jgi:hypothetical protein
VNKPGCPRSRFETWEASLNRYIRGCPIHAAKHAKCAAILHMVGDRFLDPASPTTWTVKPLIPKNVRILFQISNFRRSQICSLFYGFRYPLIQSTEKNHFAPLLVSTMPYVCRQDAREQRRKSFAERTLQITPAIRGLYSHTRPATPLTRGLYSQNPQKKPAPLAHG